MVLARHPLVETPANRLIEKRDRGKVVIAFRGRDS
jgi:hypothetical protein